MKNTTIKRLRRKIRQPSKEAGDSFWTEQAGEQLAGKVRGKLLLSALLEIGSYENSRYHTQKYLLIAHVVFPWTFLMFVYSLELLKRIR